MIGFIILSNLNKFESSDVGFQKLYNNNNNNRKIS